MGKTILLRTISNRIEINRNPYQSIYDIVKRAYEDLKAQGARPLALSDCLNYGNPDDPGVAYQIREGLRGLADACRDLQIPVVGGNVSLYNETHGKSILNQMIVGMIGILEKEN